MGGLLGGRRDHCNNGCGNDSSLLFFFLLLALIFCDSGMFGGDDCR